MERIDLEYWWAYDANIAAKQARKKAIREQKKIRKQREAEEEIKSQARRAEAQRIAKLAEEQRISRLHAMIKDSLEQSANIHIISISEQEDGGIVVTYVSDGTAYLSGNFHRLQRKLGRPVQMVAVHSSDQAVKTIIRERRRREKEKRTDVMQAPGVGAKTKARLEKLGIRYLEDLRGKDADELFSLDCESNGEQVHRSYLIAYRKAVAYANDKRPRK